MTEAAADLERFLAGRRFGTVLADPPWRFTNRTGKVAPEHRRLARYPTLTLGEICALPVAAHMDEPSHCYLWVPNALLPEGLAVLAAWGFEYKSNIVWHKIRKDGGSDGRGVGFYFRNVTELLLFGVRGKNARTEAPGRRQVNMIRSADEGPGAAAGPPGLDGEAMPAGPNGAASPSPGAEAPPNIIETRKREHSRKPDEQYPLIEGCSWGPYLELFGRGAGRPDWVVWGDQAADDYKPDWATYGYNSGVSAE
jgi:N6-adenosine-specific RNA methylase IME4